jgi:signal peptidase II
MNTSLKAKNGAALNSPAFSVKNRKSALLVMFIMLLDSITKACFYNADFILIPNIVKIYGTKNYGAAFSFLSSRPQHVALLSFALIILLFVVIRQTEDGLFNIALNLVLAGALGNFLDRLMHGFVVDFIKPLFISFPVFNVADISITIGAIISCIAVLFLESKCLKK